MLTPEYSRLLITYSVPNRNPVYLLPLKHHATPLLSINRESRHVAKSFYTVRLDVYETLHSLDSNFNAHGIPSAYGSMQQIHSVRDSQIKQYRQRMDYFDSLWRAIKSSGKVKGVIYLNPELDFFITTTDTDFPSSLRARGSSGTGGVPRGWQEKSCHFVIAEIPREIGLEIRNVVSVAGSLENDAVSWRLHTRVVEWYDERDWEQYIPDVSPLPPHAYRLERASSIWGAWFFSRIRNYQHLCLPEAELDNLIDNIIDARGRGSYRFRKWVVCPQEPTSIVEWCDFWLLFDLGELQRQNRDIGEFQDHFELPWLEAANTLIKSYGRIARDEDSVAEDEESDSEEEEPNSEDE